MNRKFEPESEESINLIIESLRNAGIECRRTKKGEEGGIFYRDENGERKKFTENIFVKRSLKIETERTKTMKQLSYAEIKRLKTEYPEGTRIILDHMEPDPNPVPDGMTGEVLWVNDNGTIACLWDNGRQLAVIPGVDKFHKL